MVLNSIFSFICIVEIYFFEIIFLFCFFVELGVDCLVLEVFFFFFLELLLLVFLLLVELLFLLGFVVRVLLFVDWGVVELDFLFDENEDWVNLFLLFDLSNVFLFRFLLLLVCYDKKNFFNILFYFKIYF